MELTKQQQLAADTIAIRHKERVLGETLSRLNKITNDWNFNTDETKDAWYADTAKRLSKKRDRLEIELCALKGIEQIY